MKEIRMIQTRLDGEQPVEFWDQEEFRGRVNKLLQFETAADLFNKNFKTIEEKPIPDDYIVCDYCDKDINEFPVPVFHGHALCPECYSKYIEV